MVDNEGFRRTTFTGEMAIAALYMQEQISDGVQVICGPKLYDEIRSLQRMTLAERIAARDATTED